MKKIETREEREKRESRNKLIIGMVLVVLMVLSTAGYAFLSGDNQQDSTKKIEYNGIKFEFGNDGKWHSEISGYQYITYYNAKDTENITGFITKGVERYSGKPVYFEYESSRDSVDEIARNIGRFGARVQYACLNECKEEWPLKKCTEDNVFIVKAGEKILISQEDNCVYITAPSEDILRASDAFIFKSLGIN